MIEPLKCIMSLNSDVQNPRIKAKFAFKLWLKQIDIQDQ